MKRLRLTNRNVDIEPIQDSFLAIYRRLRELENQIEDGILVDCKNYYAYAGDDGHIYMKRNNIFPEIYDLTLLRGIKTLESGEEYINAQKPFREQYTCCNEEHK